MQTQGGQGTGRAAFQGLPSAFVLIQGGAQGTCREDHILVCLKLKIRAPVGVHMTESDHFGKLQLEGDPNTLSLYRQGTEAPKEEGDTQRFLLLPSRCGNSQPLTGRG